MKEGFIVEKNLSVRIRDECRWRNGMSENRITSKKDYIINSHNRCKAFEVERDRLFSRNILVGNDLLKRLEENRDLIDTAEPYMNKLYNFVKGSNFFSLLTDSEGCILSIIGDSGILAEAFSLKMVPGAYMDEASIGTNSMGTALVEGKPLQVSGEEHYIKSYHRWTCSASPIRNPKGEIIGSIDLTGYSESVNLHTLGMVVAAANAIEEMIDIKRYTEELFLEKKFTETIIDSIETGILTIDLNGGIKTVNHVAADMFGYHQNEIKDMEIGELVENWDRIKSLILSSEPFTDEDVLINGRRNRMQFSVSAYPHLNGAQKLMNIVLVVKEVKKVRKLANRIMGHQAYYTFDKIISKDDSFLRIIDYAKKIADSRSNVLIMGESGTGKELFAQAIHNGSSRREEPFVAINCGAIPRTLIESELFGYEGGAYTGAKSGGQPGKFEVADGGTIFLDEIGEMPLDMQTRLLRVLEEGTVSRVGGIKETLVDVRVIAATNKDLNEEVKKGNFRMDLYYRLNVLPIRLIPLRERKNDIPILIRYFMERISKKLDKERVDIDESVMSLFLNYEWPGNVRELENIIELLVNTEVLPDNLFRMEKPLGQSSSGWESIELPVFEYGAPSENLMNLESVEKAHIIKVLDLYQGNISVCAKTLGIGRNTLYRKMESYGIHC